MTRRLAAILAAAALTAGCAAPPKGKGKTVAGKAALKEKDRSEKTNDGERYPKVTPVFEPVGRVASVNVMLQFAVVDFAGGRLPPIGAPLLVYRNGKRVGELRASGPAMGTALVADVIAGDARPGDEVRAR